VIIGVVVVFVVSLGIPTSVSSNGVSNIVGGCKEGGDDSEVGVVLGDAFMLRRFSGIDVGINTDDGGVDVGVGVGVDIGVDDDGCDDEICDDDASMYFPLIGLLKGALRKFLNHKSILMFCCLVDGG